MTDGECYFKHGIVSKTDAGAVVHDALVGGSMVWLTYLQHEIAAAEISNEWLQVGSMTAATIEKGTEPRPHSRLTVIAWLGNHDM